jgi:hypothetical protein
MRLKFQKINSPFEASPDSRKLMNLTVYFPSQAEALPRVSYRDRREGALAFFGAVNKRDQIQSPFLNVRRFLDSVFVGTKME